MMKKLLLSLCLLLAVFSSISAQQLINQRQITLLEKARRPNDHWPRGDGHALIAEPGSPLTQKAYYEPGGSFSPAPGSFGVAIWVLNDKNEIITTSDKIPLDSIHQQFIFKNGNRIPSIEAVTPYYTATWSFVDHGKWLLEITNAKQPTKIVFRGVGPAAGPLESSIWDKTRLLLNHRWIVTASSDVQQVFAGDEEKGDLLKTSGLKDSATSFSGWSFAQLKFVSDSFTLSLADTKPQFASVLSYQKTAPQFTINLPDKRFEASLTAQVANLMQGYIGRQTGPGEPINYPLAWERDGAYSLMAMAKSGNLQTARELSEYFAENDYFGGFGAEGDAAGSAINALTETALLINDPKYYEYVWPHIQRKLTLIDSMMHAKADVYRNYIGPIAPHLQDNLKRRQLISRKSDEGLIIGTMDLHFPVLYINAISYRGLQQAAKLANYFKKPDIAAACLVKADSLKAAWTRGFGKEKYDNERNFMISIWPSWITNKSNELFQQKIETQRSKEWGPDQPLERPLWTYFTVSEAHQWLFLDKPEITWQTINYFWKNQCSPGLYTYWEGNGEENSFRQWENYRGWLQPKYVTPHYWTASEMTLLQLDMLVYIDESEPDYQLVIGAGVPKEWLDQPMSVKEYKTKAGIVSWEYKKGQLNVTVKGASKKYKVIPGINFRNNSTKLNVTYR